MRLSVEVDDEIMSGTYRFPNASLPYSICAPARRDVVLLWEQQLHVVEQLYRALYPADGGLPPRAILLLWHWRLGQRRAVSHAWRRLC